VAGITGPHSLGLPQSDHGIRLEWTPRALDHGGRAATTGIADHRGRPDGGAPAALQFSLHRANRTAATAGALPPHPSIAEHHPCCGSAVSLRARPETGA
jgi:hypothetical protein